MVSASFPKIPDVMQKRAFGVQEGLVEKLIQVEIKYMLYSQKMFVRESAALSSTVVVIKV